ncbi:hypothetical protein GCM10017083_02490 [Thalassobaculum fulvum]|uniref:histidine kinase n=1 Tax=Thalassobaculum fulvum TaxID=1633335 RepID=A0A918XNT0_9PROT|nr:ATP-binding protein [Thalassobaculum fulvum]GHD39882.1 hypothetical protein GCM10017083_02490 [Thalassobaculum fulvum]
MTDDRPVDPEEPAAGPAGEVGTAATVRVAAARAAIMLILPTAVALLVLTALDALPPLHALAALAAVAGGVFLLVRRHFAALAVVRRRLDERVAADDLRAAMSDGRDALDAVGEAGPVADLALALERADRRTLDWMARATALSEARALVIDSIPDPLLLIDERGRVSQANREARRQLGRQIVDRDLSTVLRHPEILATVRRALAGGPGGDVEIGLAAPVERVFNVRVESLNKGGPGGAAALMLFVDLSSIRRAEQMRVDFVANVSHELRTPLATLLGFIETLQGPARDDAEARDRFLDIMKAQGNRMSRLVQDLLSLSRIETNEHRPPSDRVALGPLLEGVKATLDLEARRKDMAVRLDADPALPAVIGAEDELAQVAQNLLDNAIKYGRPGTEITVSARPADRLPASFPGGPGAAAVAISVRDRGDGIPAEHIPRLTERFYRVDTARSRELGGTGLGLAIVKHIVSRHRGALAIQSTPGEGSVFTVYIPAAGAESWPSGATAA